MSSFVSEKYLLGIFKASTIFGSHSSLGTTELQTGPETYFLHVGVRPLFTILITLLTLSLAIFLPHRRNHFHKNYFAFPVLILSLGLLSYDFFQSSHIPGNPLGTEVSLTVSGNVKQALGLKSVTLPGEEKAIYFTSSNPLGSSLWSLQNHTRTELVTIPQYSEPLFEVILDATQETYPSLMLPTGY